MQKMKQKLLLFRYGFVKMQFYKPPYGFDEFICFIFRETKEMIKIGKVLVVEFQDEDSEVFNKIMAVLKQHDEFERISINGRTVISFPGFEIHFQQRKVYCGKEKFFLQQRNTIFYVCWY